MVAEKKDPSDKMPKHFPINTRPDCCWLHLLHLVLCIWRSGTGDTNWDVGKRWCKLALGHLGTLHSNLRHDTGTPVSLILLYIAVLFSCMHNCCERILPRVH